MLEDVTPFPKVLLQTWPLGARWDALAETAWARVPVHGVLQGHAGLPAFRTGFGVSVPPQCLGQPRRGFLAL